MPRMLAAVVLAVLVAGAGVACGNSDGESATTVTATSVSPPPPTTIETGGGIDPLEGAGTAPVVGEASGSETALLERVAIGRHEGYDRVVFQFRNAVPGYRVEYVEPPLHEDGSGARVEVAGSAFVVVRMERASGFDLSVPEGEMVYTGPRRLSGADAGTSIVREVVRTGDFEAVLTWAVGLSDRVEFRVTRLRNPARLVVDFRNH